MTCLTGPSTVAGVCNFHFCSPSTFFWPSGGEYFQSATLPIFVPPASVPTE